jgi:hypothetical protein
MARKSRIREVKVRSLSASNQGLRDYENIVESFLATKPDIRKGASPEIYDLPLENLSIVMTGGAGRKSKGRKK